MEWLNSILYEEKSLIEFLLMRQALHIVPTSELLYYYNAVQPVFRKGWVQRAINNAMRDREILEILKNIEEKGVISSKGLPCTRFRPPFFSGKLTIAKRDEGIFRTPYYCTLERLHPDIDLSSVDEATACQWLDTKTNTESPIVWQCSRRRRSSKHKGNRRAYLIETTVRRQREAVEEKKKQEW